MVDPAAVEPSDADVGPPDAAGAAAAGEPAALRAVPSGIQSPDPRCLALDRTIGWIVFAIVAGFHALMALVVLVFGDWPRWGSAAVALSWFPVAGGLVWLAVRWPAIDFRHRRYRLHPGGIDIWTGVLWRQAIAVPRSRIQHIDVTQGPIERSYGLGTLSVFTAGTEHSKVDLRGLDHGLALLIRDALLPRDDERAV